MREESQIENLKERLKCMDRKLDHVLAELAQLREKLNARNSD